MKIFAMSVASGLASGLAFFLLLVAVGCGDDTSVGGSASAGTGGEGGAPVDDGKFHPPTNGVSVAQAAACSKVESAFQSRLSGLACVATAPSCPGLIWAPTGAEPCSSFDEGTVQGCADYVAQSADCEDLTFRLGDCIVEPIEGSAPNGCPT